MDQMSVYEGLTDSQQFACRVIADHARSTAFAIADGILPGNEGRNYVLRKIMRRAIYHGREHLGLNDLFFYKVCDFVVSEMSGAYPELETQRDFIGKMVRIEEERFGNTLSTGWKNFKSEFADAFDRVHKSYEIFEERILDGSGVDVAYQSSSEYLQQVQERHGSAGLQHPARLFGMLYKYRIPPFLFNAFLNSNAERLRTRSDTLEWFCRLATRDSETFESVIGREWRDFLSAYGTSEEKKIVVELNNPVGVARWLDTYFAGDESVPLPTISDFARIYDTYGYPPDLIRVALEERGIELSEDDFTGSFNNGLQELQKQAGVGHTERKSQISPVYAEMLEKIGVNKFQGYDSTQVTGSKVVAILDGEKQVNELNEGAQGGVILDQTPFYAEAGGQVGDVGQLISADSTATVADTYSPVTGLIIHKVTVDRGSIKVGDSVTATVDAEKRDATRRNHSATHLVHAALREVLGTHVKQGGSVVAPNILRFDFTHYQPMTATEIAEVEDLVNREILKNEPVNTNVMAIEEAMAGGAMALFGEKYGSAVRVLSVGDGAFSKELCGGTHVRATGDIGSFKITADEAIASGVRRIRAITGFDAFERFREDEKLIERSLHELNTQRDNLPNAIAKLQDELKKTRKEMDELKLKIATGSIGETSSNGDEARDIAGIKVLAKQVDGLDANGQRQLSDTLLARLKSGVVILGRASDDKVSIIVRVSDDLTNRVKAGDIIREIAPIVGGKGGGKADMAEGGGTEPAKLAEAIDASYGVIEKMLE